MLVHDVKVSPVPSPKADRTSSRVIRLSVSRQTKNWQTFTRISILTKMQNKNSLTLTSSTSMASSSDSSAFSSSCNSMSKTAAILQTNDRENFHNISRLRGTEISWLGLSTLCANISNVAPASCVRIGLCVQNTRRWVLVLHRGS